MVWLGMVVEIVIWTDCHCYCQIVGGCGVQGLLVRTLDRVWCKIEIRVGNGLCRCHPYVWGVRCGCWWCNLVAELVSSILMCWTWTHHGGTRSVLLQMWPSLYQWVVLVSWSWSWTLVHDACDVCLEGAPKNRTWSSLFGYIFAEYSASLLEADCGLHLFFGTWLVARPGGVGVVVAGAGRQWYSDSRSLSDRRYMLASGVTIWANFTGSAHEYLHGMHVHMKVSVRVSWCRSRSFYRGWAVSSWDAVEVWGCCRPVLVAYMCCSALCISLDGFIHRMCPAHYIGAYVSAVYQLGQTSLCRQPLRTQFCQLSELPSYCSFHSTSRLLSRRVPRPPPSHIKLWAHYCCIYTHFAP